MITQRETRTVVTVVPCLFFLQWLHKAHSKGNRSFHASQCPLQVYVGSDLIAPQSLLSLLASANIHISGLD